MFNIVVNPDITVEIPQIGLFYAYQGKEYEVLRTTTYQEKRDGSFIPDFTTICVILRITDEGEDAGDPTIEVNSDELTEIY